MFELFKKILNKCCHLFPVCFRNEEQELITTETAYDRIRRDFGKKRTENFQCSVTCFMSMDIIDLFQIVHIYEDEASAILLHELCSELFTSAPHRKSGEEVKAFTVFLRL